MCYILFPVLPEQLVSKVGRQVEVEEEAEERMVGGSLYLTAVEEERRMLMTVSGMREVAWAVSCLSAVEACFLLWAARGWIGCSRV